jgi:hypothetical protein
VIRRIRFAGAAFALSVAVLLGAGAPASPDSAPAGPVAVVPGPHDDGPHPPLIGSAQAPPVRPRLARKPAVAQGLPGGGVEISGLDLHDSMVTHLPDGRYAVYGTMYGCGYQWYVSGTPWCGFGVSTAPSLAGPWSTPTLLFSPSSIDPWSGLTWAAECGGTGQGCFNPRMVIRSGWGYNDAVPILWFNSPVDYSRNHANAYNAMGCATPLGPCGPGATPNGSYSKPSLSVCSGNGDFGIIQTGGRPAIVCTMPGAAALNIEELTYSGTGGDGTGVRGVAGLSAIEGPGGFWDADAGLYVLTYSDPGCGYCSGTGTGYAVAPSLFSGWQAPGNVGFSPPVGGRRSVSATSCGGQPRTVSVVDGVPYQGIDTWTGDSGTSTADRNQTAAGTIYTPLAYAPATGVPGDGHRWVPPVSYAC